MKMVDLKDPKKIDIDAAIYSLSKGSYVISLAGMTILFTLCKEPIIKKDDPQYLLEHIEWMRKYVRRIIEEETYEVVQ